MASARERRLQPQLQDLVGERECDDPSAHREHVGVVVLARQPRGEQVVAECRTDARDLVRGNLLALAAAAENDAAIGPPFRHRAADRHADRRVIDRLLAVRPEVVDGVAEALERWLEMFLERKAGVIGANRDAHRSRIVLWVSLRRRSWSPHEASSGRAAAIPGSIART